MPYQPLDRAAAWSGPDTARLYDTLQAGGGDPLRSKSLGIPAVGRSRPLNQTTKNHTSAPQATDPRNVAGRPSRVTGV